MRAQTLVFLSVKNPSSLRPSSVEIVSERFEDFGFDSFVRFDFRGLFECFDVPFLLRRKFFRDIDADVHDDVPFSVAIALHAGQSFASESECGSRLCSRLDFDSCLSVNGWHFHGVAEDGLRQGEEEIVNQVVFVADEFRVRFFLDDDLNVSRDSCVRCGVSFSLDVQHHSFLDAGGDVDFHDVFALHDSFTVTFGTLVFDDDAFTVAVRTGCLSLHHSEDASLRLHHVACAVAF